MSQEFSTPMMKQYLGIKQKYPDCLLFYRMGDFYELFLDDALVGAKILGITLTSRSKGKDGRIPMAGVPYHAVDSYLTKLVKAGYKVAICEQLSPPNKKGLVDRDVVRIITPGTIMDEKALETKENNYIVSITKKDSKIGIAFADISTGEFVVDQQDVPDPLLVLHQLIEHYRPVECLLSSSLYEDSEFIKELRKHPTMHITHISSWMSQVRQAHKTLTSHFGLHTLESFEIHSLLFAQEAAAVLLTYLSDTQKGNISHIRRITRISHGDHVILDRATQINLELFSTIREHDQRGSVLSILDRTDTAMGGRMLKRWMMEPLCDHDAICERLDSVEELLLHQKNKKLINSHLERIHDVERMLSRLSVGIGNARDLVNLMNALQEISEIALISDTCTSSLLKNLFPIETREHVQSVISEIRTSILPEPKITLKEGGIICDGVHPRLDTLRELLSTGEEWLKKFETAQREQTNINSLKVRFNSVFGYYIEITNANIHRAPSGYIRKQTLINGERFITAELKAHEEKILTAQEEIYRIEYDLYQQTLEKVLSETSHMQSVAQTIGVLDCLCSFATNATEYSYCKPKILFSNELRIQDGRHPVVEKLLTDTPFVPNSVTLDPIKQQLLIITGPNMAGKSVFVRQVALLVLLAHIGSFVPARSAHIGVVDRIFVRSGASDMITSGLSTFMVEMVETAAILHNATEKSLVIMDEIGRGTSTYDGISIAWAVASYLAINEASHAKTLFATHYHELQELAELFPTRIQNYHMEVIEEKDGPRFVHTLLQGKSTSSFGIAVAKRAGVPEKVIEIATQKLQELEKDRDYSADEKTHQLKQDDPKLNALKTELLSLHLSTMTPLQALNTLAALQERMKQ
ncbi:MAG: DNA mismatch repair protein MutS [Candidatus Woesebacteria bacterium]